ncbi:hypothetical protein COV13_02185 [Candidatus Woesearchaeota archaeon CG10_big_fil_rev_8_21_14_0_10_32_9]|nr:MAG: hypothetical protein COV13_02185 [Candidatus Woesearchaeota archaeon CG10_big_fil_rev_8_21_14_0_10_32_9]
MARSNLSKAFNIIVVLQFVLLGGTFVLGIDVPDIVVADVEGEFLFETLDDFDSTNFFIVRNLNYYSNFSQPIEVSVIFELNETKNNIATSDNWIINKSINSYSKTFGEVNLTNETNSFCVKIVTLNADDSNQNNNRVCFFKETTTSLNETNSTLNESENNTINTTTNVTITITNNLNSTNSSFNEDYCAFTIYSDKTVYLEGESISFKFEAEEESFERGITYWIEDSRGKIVKTNLSTNSNSAKRFTPKLERSNELYSIKAEVNGCENYSEFNLFFSGSDEIIPEKSSFLRVKEIKITPSLFSVNLEGYRNSTNKKTIYIWIDGTNIKKEKQKILIEEKDIFFFLNIAFDVSNLKQNTTLYLNAEGLDLEFMQNYSYVFKQINKTPTELSQNIAQNKEKTETLNIPSSLKSENDSVNNLINSKTSSNLITGNVVASKSNASSSIFSVILVIVIFVSLYFFIKVLVKHFKKRKII